MTAVSPEAARRIFKAFYLIVRRPLPISNSESAAIDTSRITAGNPLVSVVIPAYNAEAHIEECIESVVAQQVDFATELIVVDDGSTDNTWALLSKHAAAILLRQDNRGPAAARNAGVRQAQGHFVAFLDADDLWPAGKLQLQVDLMRKHPDAAMCFGDCRQFDESDWWPQTLFDEGAYGESGWGHGPYLPGAYTRLLDGGFLTTGSVVVRRAVLEAVGEFAEDLRLVEDLDLWLRIARLHPILWCKAVCLLRRRHANNTSREQEAMGLAYLDVLRRHKTLYGAELARQKIDLDLLAAREYRQLAERALADGRPKDAMRWSWTSFTTRPALRALWSLGRSVLQQLSWH